MVSNNSLKWLPESDFLHIPAVLFLHMQDWLNVHHNQLQVESALLPDIEQPTHKQSLAQVLVSKERCFHEYHRHEKFVTEIFYF